MIAIPSGVRVLVSTKPVDFRKGADGLAALAKEVLKQDSFSSVVLVFGPSGPIGSRWSAGTATAW